MSASSSSRSCCCRRASSPSSCTRRPQEKEALLQQLFGTDRFSRVEDWLADRRRATDKEVAAAREDVNRLMARIAQAAGADVPDERGR